MIMVKDVSDGKGRNHFIGEGMGGVGEDGEDGEDGEEDEEDGEDGEEGRRGGGEDFLFDCNICFTPKDLFCFECASFIHAHMHTNIYHRSSFIVHRTYIHAHTYRSSISSSIIEMNVHRSYIHTCTHAHKHLSSIIVHRSSCFLFSI